MALMTPQPISTVITPSFTQPTTSDTISADSGLILYVKVGATSTTITIVVPSYELYIGTINTDLVVSSVTNTERAFYLPREIASGGLITVTYSQVTNVTSALFKI